MKLYSYWRSTTALRARAALNLKGIPHEMESIDLYKGRQASDAFTEINRARGVPVLELDDGTRLTQSLAIIDYLDALYPDPPMLPRDALERARVLSASYAIAMDIHPVNNLKIINYLKNSFGRSQDEVVEWMNHWMREGFAAYNQLIRRDAPFSFGDRLTLADICLVGQMINARRWNCDTSDFSRLEEIDARARSIPAIHQSLPEQQPDAE